VCRVLPYDKDLTQKKFETKTSLFIKGISKNWTHKDLYEFFKHFGDISSAKVSLDENHLSRGYGFVQFQKEEYALRALQEVTPIPNFIGRDFSH
jgi:RNA recognition motif-containing protein